MFQFPLLSIPIVQLLLYMEKEMHYIISYCRISLLFDESYSISKQTNVLTWRTTISVKNELFLWIQPKTETFYPTRSNKTDDATDTTAVTLSKHRNYFIWCRLLEMLFFFGGKSWGGIFLLLLLLCPFSLELSESKTLFMEYGYHKI